MVFLNVNKLWEEDSGNSADCELWDSGVIWLYFFEDNVDSIVIVNGGR